MSPTRGSLISTIPGQWKAKMRKQKPCTQAHPSFEKERMGNPWQGEEGGKFLSV